MVGLVRVIEESLYKAPHFKGVLEEHTSGAEGRLDFAGLNTGVKTPAYRPNCFSRPASGAVIDAGAEALEDVGGDQPGDVAAEGEYFL
jgi:hypothetical protein